MAEAGIGELSSALSKVLQPAVHVEVCQKSCSTVGASALQQHAASFLSRVGTTYGDIVLTEFDDPVLQEHVDSIALCDTKLVNFAKATLYLHVYQLHQGGPVSEELDEEDDITAAQHWILPCSDFQGMWEGLVYDSDIKSSHPDVSRLMCLLQLLQYSETTLLFSDRGVDPNVIAWNRVILLHGPPGTGKTSLCKALSQKLSIRLSDHYSYGQLVEINSHSLFSKWFSESGKLVQKMFGKIHEMIADKDALVCVLIDEVESLTAARKSAMAGSEPSDAIRVVNALLTQIDQIRRFPNVVILTTSNVTGAIDLAFVDRADIKQYIGLPTPAAIYKIYSSCIKELTRVGIVTPAQQILELRALEVMRFVANEATHLSLKLWDIACRSKGLSGRTLRKLPFLAHALYIQSSSTTLDLYLDSLGKAVAQQFRDRENLAETHT